MNKGSGIHTLGRGNLGNINSKYPLHKPTIFKSNVEDDAVDGDECHATAIAAPPEENVEESSQDAKSSEDIGSRDSKQQNDGDVTDSFHALISKFERKVSTQKTSTQPKENEAGVAVDVGERSALESDGVVKRNHLPKSTDSSLERKDSKKAIATELSEDNTSPIPASVSSNHVREIVDNKSQTVEGVIHGKKNSFNALLSKFEKKSDKSLKTSLSPQLPPSAKVTNSAGDTGNASESTSNVTPIASHSRTNTDAETTITPTDPNDISNEGTTVAVAKKSSSKVKISSFLRSKSKSESDSIVVATVTPPSSKTHVGTLSPPHPPSCQVDKTDGVSDERSSGETHNNAVSSEKTSQIPPFDNVVTDEENNQIVGKKKSIDELISKFERADEPRQTLSHGTKGSDTASSADITPSVTPFQQPVKSQVDVFAQPPGDAKTGSDNNENIITSAPAEVIISNIQSSAIVGSQEIDQSNQSKFGRQIKHAAKRAPELIGDEKPPTLIPRSTSENEGRNSRHDSTESNRDSVPKSSFSMKFPSFLKTRSKSEPTVPVNHTKQQLPSGSITTSNLKEVATGIKSARDMNRDENKCDNHVRKKSGSIVATESTGHEKTTTPSESLEEISKTRKKTDVPLPQSFPGHPKQIPSPTPPSTTRKGTSLLVSRSTSEPLTPVSQPDTVKTKHQPQQDVKQNKEINSKKSISNQHPPKRLNAHPRIYHQSKSQARPSQRGQSTSKPRKDALKSPKLNLHLIPQKSDCVSISPRYSMVSPKSHQRLVLEEMAAKYFLNDPKLSNAKYLGVTAYANGDTSLSKGEKDLGNIDENYDFIAQCTTSQLIGMGARKAREDVISFLEGTDKCATDDNNTTHVESNSSININDTTQETSSSNSKSDAEQDHMMETNIDLVFELANEHLSLGRNDLALQAYCHAMKIAFADVLSVKNKLAKLKNEQGDSSPTELIKQQEKVLESSLLQVASRVADVHNNMGVVYEMNCQFEAARTSYIDALEVYHNTCKRIEEQGDPDVDRTKYNIDRMEKACSSEKQRKELHQTASCIAKKLDQERHSTKRKSLLIEAVETLRTALELETSTVGSTHPVTANTLIQLGKYHYELRDFDSAVMEIRQATRILRCSLGENHPQVGKSTLLLANIYERHGVHVSPQGTIKDDIELELYVDALGPLKATLGEINTEIGLLYEKIGHMYGKKGDASLSLLAYKASLKAYGEPTLPANERVQLEVVSIWVRVTEISTFLKAWDEVLISGSRALYLLRNLKNTLFRTAELASKPNGGNEHTNRQASVMPIASSSKVSDIHISADMYYETLFNTLQSLGQAHTSLTHYSLARDACSESLQLAWEMALSSHESNAVIRVIRALKRLGKALLLDKHYNSALQCFLPCLELLRSSKETETSLDCASVLGSIGYLYLKLSKFTESSNFLRQCMKLHQDHEVESNDRETRKIQAWLQLAESREGEVSVGHILSEIPTIFVDETKRFGG